MMFPFRSPNVCEAWLQGHEWHMLKVVATNETVHFGNDASCQTANRMWGTAAGARLAHAKGGGDNGGGSDRSLRLDSSEADWRQGASAAGHAMT